MMLMEASIECMPGRSARSRKILLGRIFRAVSLAVPFAILLGLQLNESFRCGPDAARSLRVENDAVALALSQNLQKQQHHRPPKVTTTTKTTTTASNFRERPAYERTTLSISLYEVSIRYPARAWDRLNASHPTVVAGVISTASNREKRDSIRSTWAFDRSNVFFVVAGEWSPELEEEAQRHQDLLWMDDDEDYRRISWKTLVFFRAMRKWVGNAHYVLKTDDDAYVNLAVPEQRIRQQQEQSTIEPFHYLGYCIRDMPPAQRQMLEEVYPPYASGAGYVISNFFLTCLDNKADHWVLLQAEDANTGMMARECGVPCHHDERIFPWRNFDDGSWNLYSHDSDDDNAQEDPGWLHHYVKATEEMTYIHANVCKSKHADEISCAFGSDQTIPDELPLYCNERLVDSCGQCVEEDPYERAAPEICNASCHFCPFATEEPTRCIPKSQACIPPPGFVPPPPPPGWFDEESDDGATPPQRPERFREDKDGEVS